VHDDVQRIQQYGFTSNPKPGAQAITLFFGGNREDGVIICTDDKRYRLRSLQPGEVALYTDEGDSIQLKRNNEIKITSSGTVKIECDDVEIGGGTMRKLIDERMIDIFNTHIHASSGVVPSTLITVPSTVTTTKTAAS
jgi:phage baseplate assembly protein V